MVFRAERLGADGRGDEQVGGGTVGEDAERKVKEVNFHKLIWEEYFPLAFSIGISLEQFKKLTPKTLGYCLKGEELRRKEYDSEMWSWWGNYGISAVTCALDHCLNGKKAKTKYIKNLYCKASQSQKTVLPKRTFKSNSN